jgi:hypothetical protein
VEFFQGFASEILIIAAFCAVCMGIHKLYQMATTLNEIKELLKSQRRHDAAASGTMAGFPGNLTTDPSDDDATLYAQNLLRAVNAEQQHTGAGRSE